MRFLYSVLVHVLRPLAVAVLLWRGLRNRAYWAGLTERFGLGTRVSIPTVWLHAVSLGEVNAAASLIRALRARHPHVPVTLTTATPTGRARARALFGAEIEVRLLPYDTPGAMRGLIARVRPRLLIVMETELWPNLFDQCRRQRIPVLLASARLSEKSVSMYRRFGSLFRDVFADDTLVAAQSTADAERFLAIGAAPDRICVVGNVKFDVGENSAVAAQGAELRSAHWPQRSVWIAGSTHAGEDEQVLAAHAEVQDAVPGALLLLVPRHPERFQAVADLLNRSGVHFERRSSGNAVRPETQVLLVDTVGELATLYAATDVAFVGGSLMPVGGHNLLEPAALGLPVITGTSQANGLEIARLLIQEGAALEVAGAAQLAGEVGRLLADPAERARIGARGRAVVEANRGSVGRLMTLIEARLVGPHPAGPH